MTTKKSNNNFPHLSQERLDKWKDCPSEFLDAANEYFEIEQKFYKMKRELDLVEKQMMEKKKIYYSSCKHNYKEEPRQYQTPREWVCLICGHYI